MAVKDDVGKVVDDVVAEGAAVAGKFGWGKVVAIVVGVAFVLGIVVAAYIGC